MNTQDETPKRVECREAIKAKVRQIETLHNEIDQIAKSRIRGFHFLRHKVSTSWACDLSPIGMCVWDVDSPKGFHIDCRCIYCGDPVERK